MVRAPLEATPAPVISQTLAGRYGFEVEGHEGEGPRLSVSVLLRSKWLILGIFFVISATAIPPVWLLVVPKYSATASIRVAPVIPKLIYDTEANSAGRYYGSYVNTQIANLTSPVILQRVLEREEVKRTQWFNEQPRTLRTVLGASPPGRLARLKAGLSAANRRNTELIEVEMVTTVPADAHVIVNALVDEYMRYVAETTGEADELLFKALRDQRRALEDKIERLVEQIGNLSKHLEKHRKDVHSRRGLVLMASRRNRLLRYLQREDYGRYRALIERLGLRK